MNLTAIVQLTGVDRPDPEAGQRAVQPKEGNYSPAASRDRHAIGPGSGEEDLSESLRRKRQAENSGAREQTQGQYVVTIVNQCRDLYFSK